MINRKIKEKAKALSKKFPVLTLLGPRQSGKTTLAKLVFPDYSYVSLEDLDARKRAVEDPRGFLKVFKKDHGIIIDEVQHAPDLLSYIQTYVDASGKEGEFVLTGSQNLLVSEKITQSLAGRVAILTLLPLSLSELKSADLLTDDHNEAIYRGFYPRLHAKNMDPNDWYSNYLQTYIERDVRQLKAIADLSQFQMFMKLCAGRCGQLLNITNLSNDSGVSMSTVKNWLSILEATYIIYRLSPHHANFKKRLVKSPKLYFYDVGLAAHLLGIQDASDVANHFLKGGLFESMIISDLRKQSYNLGKRPQLYFWRDKTGDEVDCIIEKGLDLTPIEIKAAQTLSSSHFEPLIKWSHLTNSDPKKGYLIYGGDTSGDWKEGNVLSWSDLDSLS